MLDYTACKTKEDHSNKTAFEIDVKHVKHHTWPKNFVVKDAHRTLEIDRP